MALEVAQHRAHVADSTFNRALLEFLQNRRPSPTGEEWRQYPFVISFCEGCDRSGQWLHYGRSGRGAALGFNPGAAEVFGLGLVAVNYDETSQRAKFETLFHSVEAISGVSDWEVAAHLTNIYARVLAAGMKHPSFADEREWRFWGDVLFKGSTLISNEPDLSKIQFRASGERIIPYEALSLCSFTRRPGRGRDRVLLCNYRGCHVACPGKKRYVLRGPSFGSSCEMTRLPK